MTDRLVKSNSADSLAFSEFSKGNRLTARTGNKCVCKGKRSQHEQTMTYVLSRQFSILSLISGTICGIAVVSCRRIPAA
jgi:hypothetical protein